MLDNDAAPYKLYYWPGLQGRGELVRLAFEEAGVPYVDVVRLPQKEGGGIPALRRILDGKAPGLLPFAPPVLEHGELLIAQAANILLYLGPRLGLVPADEAGRLSVHQLQLTLADLISEVHDTHHPTTNMVAYEEQKPEALKRAAAFVAQRIPRFLGYFEDVLARSEKSGGRYLVGKDLTYADLSLFQAVSGLGYAFPNAMARVTPETPRVVALRDEVAARPRLAAYLASPRRVPFNEHGIFRRYPELDAEPA